MAIRSSRHRTVAVDIGASRPSEPRRWPWPWYVAALAGPLGVLAAGWVVLAALTTVGWLTSPEAELTDALRLAADLLILAHGAPVTIAGQAVSIAPLGLTAGLVFLALPAASWAARQAAGQAGHIDDTGDIWADAEAVALRVGATFAGVYAAAVVIVAASLGVGSWRVLVGGLVVGGIAGLWGASKSVGHDPTHTWPGWLRAVPRALGAALLVVLAGASAVFVTALWLGRERVTDIVVALDGGVPALALLTALHLAYLPNLLLASASWMLGAGITVGDQSLVTMALSDVGFLPAIPVFGAVPVDASPASFWWLVVGVAAGCVAALAVALARPRARFDETALVGGLSGVAAGLLLVVLCALGSGSLGSDRLAHLGARVGELAVFAPTLLGLAGMAAGLILGLVRRPPRAAGASEDAPPADDAPADGAPPADDAATSDDSAAADEATERTTLPG
ncbi:DUF6350 family protein [Tessaracoccus flavus]|uniref:Uncharacterized protein n=1 Tax=Tessaracoccus flavus TaxID=1610493 RepID=A0A1Q2CG17_9ACTN|nr:DUF6350 family protein [Tessaracoccus flavus]AQP45053.1 hypothetical protein RPIT_09855 [Tessaracoccus flavus]SDY57915.1 hypothetical protein SAMN05428934_102335 [Tessaracoccus flavus]